MTVNDGDQPVRLARVGRQRRVDAAGHGILDRLVEVADRRRDRRGADSRRSSLSFRCRAAPPARDPPPRRRSARAARPRVPPGAPGERRRSMSSCPDFRGRQISAERLQAMAVAVDRVQRLDDLALPGPQLEPAPACIPAVIFSRSMNRQTRSARDSGGFARRSPAFSPPDRLRSWTSQSHRKKFTRTNFVPR